MERIETEDAPLALGAYSQAIKKGNLLFVSGQLPVKAGEKKIVSETIEMQIEQVLNNLEAILTAANSSWSQVVKCEIFLKEMRDFAIVDLAYSKRVCSAVPPARQTVQVAALPLNALVEISCIADLS